MAANDSLWLGSNIFGHCKNNKCRSANTGNNNWVTGQDYGNYKYRQSSIAALDQVLLPVRRKLGIYFHFFPKNEQ